MSVSDADIDAIVRGAVDRHWRKVAMIIAIALTSPSAIEDDDEGIAERVAGRIRSLIDAGEIEVAGDPTRWRHSEVRQVPR